MLNDNKLRAVINNFPFLKDFFSGRSTDSIEENLELFKDDIVPRFLSKNEFGLLKILCKLRVGHSIGPSDKDLETTNKSRVYLFANELHAHIFRRITHKGKKVAGILGCGDYMINALIHGCNQFVGIDISLFSQFFAELKFVMLKILQFEEFLNFFCVDKTKFGDYTNWSTFGAPHLYDDTAPPKIKGHPQGIQTFSPQLYSKIRPYLSWYTRAFFDSIIGYHFIDRQNRALPYSLVYVRDWIDIKKTRNIPYLRSAKHYNTAKFRIFNCQLPHFQLGDIFDFLQSSNQKWDIIYLSNVIDWMLERWGEPQLVNGILSILTKLNEGGKIIAFGEFREFNKIRRLLRKVGIKSRRYRCSIRSRARQIFIDGFAFHYMDAFVFTK